ncbi:MAG: DUF29 family protein [Aphanizomenon gracile PMC638.10]|nr:DUF29 family protein [Aphanizomenon gracile PMC638.10]
MNKIILNGWILPLTNCKNRDLENLDWEHLIEEITALGNEQRRKVESYLRQLIKTLTSLSILGK